MPALALLLAAAAAAAPSPAPYRVEVVETVEGPAAVETLLRFPSPAKSLWPANDVVWAHLIAPRGASRRPAVLVLPVMAAPNVWIETRFVRRLVKDGFTVMWIEMPTQFRRRPHPSVPSGQVFLARSPKRLAANFRQSVADARRALEVLAARPEADPDRIAVMGVSLGALVGSQVYSVDPRPKAAVFLLGGADFPGILLNGSLSGPTARRSGVTAEQLREAFGDLDPSRHKARNAGKRAWLINARGDTVIPRENALKLAEAFPSARQTWVPLGHYSAMAHLLWLPARVSGYLGETLAEGVKNR